MFDMDNNITFKDESFAELREILIEDNPIKEMVFKEIIDRVSMCHIKGCITKDVL
jgi:hypothetical protein